MNPKIAGKWMFIPLELIIIGFDPPPCGANAVIEWHFAYSADCEPMVFLE